MPQIIPTAEPFFFPGKDANARIGCLVIHGFTGAPREMRWLGEYLNHQGYTVCGVRLNGHATKPKDMIRSHWQDWLLSVEDGYEMLRSCTKHVFLLGLSMGGVLSLTFASKFQELGKVVGGCVRGVVAMSTPYKLPKHPLLWVSKPLSWIIPYMPKEKSEPDAGWFDKEAYKQHVSYPENPIRSIGELNHLLGVMRESLPQIKIPVLLIHSRDDDYVIHDSMERIFESLGSSDKTILWVEGGGHVITEEPTRQKVFRTAADFIGRVSLG